jgi:hypothetical protein
MFGTRELGGSFHGPPFGDEAVVGAGENISLAARLRHVAATRWGTK